MSSINNVDQIDISSLIEEMEETENLSYEIELKINEVLRNPKLVEILKKNNASLKVNLVFETANLAQDIPIKTNLKLLDDSMFEIKPLISFLPQSSGMMYKIVNGRIVCIPI
jgi:hypothetical protein